MPAIIVGARLALPGRAAALGLRPNVTMPRPAAPRGDVDARAEVAAGIAAARVVGGGVEGAVYV